MNATEDNKIIAEFMGLSIKEGVTYYTDSDDMFPIGIEVQRPYLPYNTSWDWLMPVVEKIRSVTSYDIDRFSTEVIIYGDKTSIKSKGYGEKEHSKSFFNKSIRGKYNSIEHTYKAVLEYVKWYNIKH
jgi:hypothetical protein